jgi:large subunit ribosomal protein L28
MSRKCDICGKHTIFGNKVSHSKNRTRRSWIPNLLSIRVNENSQTKTITICTRCLKAGKVQKVC